MLTDCCSDLVSPQRHIFPQIVEEPNAIAVSHGYLLGDGSARRIGSQYPSCSNFDPDAIPLACRPSCEVRVRNTRRRVQYLARQMVS